MTADTITWYFNETILKSNESILGINMSSFDQSGKYSCRVSNDSQEVFITFGRKPVAVKNLTCFETSITHFRCTWLPGDLDTNLPNEYQIFYGRASVLALLKYKKTHNKYIDLAYDHGKMKVELYVFNALGYHDIADVAFYSIKMYPPKNVVGWIENDTLLKVNWDPTKYKIEHVYVVSYKEVYPNMKPPEKNEIPCDRSHDDLSEKILDIPTGYKEYEVQVAVRYSREDNINKWSDIVVVMKEETKPPEGTVDGNCNWKDGYDVLTCNWKELPPEKQNGHLLKYKITVFSDDREVDIATTKYNTSLQVEFTDLPSDKDYIVNITAHNSVGYTTISSSFVAGQLTASGIGKEYIAVIIIVSIVFVTLLIIFIIRRMKKADFMKPLPEPKFYKWDASQCSEAKQPDVEIFDEVKTNRNPPKEKEDLSESTCMLPEKSCETFETGGNQRKTSVEVTNKTYLILGRKQEQQNNNVFTDDVNDDENSSSKEDADVRYLQLCNGNLLTEVQNDAMISEEPLTSVDPFADSSVPYSECDSESYLINRSTLSSGNYVSGSGTSCQTADTHLSSS
ncbi:uncharacterized protein [Antedon mediterranea]